jgi:hypothetical protein
MIEHRQQIWDTWDKTGKNLEALSNLDSKPHRRASIQTAVRICDEASISLSKKSASRTAIQIK